MRLFQYIVPLYDNAGKPYGVHPGPESSHFERWENALIGAFGGFTKGPRQFGVWTDERGKEYHDESVAYMVAVEPGEIMDAGSNDARLQGLDEAFFAVFTDQKALFRAEIGTAAIINRPD